MLEASSLAPKIRESGLIVFQNQLDRFPTPFADHNLRVQELVQRIYIDQQREGGLYDGISDEQWEVSSARHPEWTKNNTVIRKPRIPLLGWKPPIAVGYTSRRSGFRKLFHDTADALDEARDALDGVPDRNLVERELKILSKGYKTGDTDEAIREYLMSRIHPEISLWCGLQERIADRRGLKFGSEGFSFIINKKLSSDFNFWAAKVLRGLGRNVDKDQFLFTDAAIESGVATLIVFQGNTMPSQPDIAEDVGHLILFFDNVNEWKMARDVYPKLLEIAPGHVLQRIEIEGVRNAVRRTVISGHEIGHVVQNIPGGAAERLGKWYQTLKEAYAELFGYYALAKHPDTVISKDDLVAAVMFAIARKSAILDEYNQKVTKGQIKPDSPPDPYPFSSAIAKNTLLEAGILSEDDAGRCCIGDLNKLRGAAEKKFRIIDRLVLTAGQSEAEDEIIKLANHPVEFVKTAV